MKLQGKVAVITGSASNIGEATAKLFAREGAKIVINAKTNTTGAQRVQDEIITTGEQATLCIADASTEEGAKNIIDTAINKFGTIDILINNAGHGHDKDVLEATKEDWYKTLDDCLISTALCSKYAARIMLEKQSGVILNTSSIRGISYAGYEGLAAYSAAKAAVINLTITLAKRLAPFIRVNAIAPGFVYKPMYDSFPKELQKTLINATLLKRYNTIDEIAEGFLYLSTAKGVTGEVLVIDNGFLIKQD